MRRIRLVAGIGAVLPTVCFAQFYAQDFEIDSTATWTVNNGPSDAAADFFFDYSGVGIPAAPNGAGTRGMKLQANLTNGIFSGMSVSPNGQSFAGDFTLEFDWWSNINGPFPSGGSGSTNLSTFGIGTSGLTAQWPGAVQQSVWFAATGDGGSAADWRAYSSAAGASYPDGSPEYAFATRNSSDPYFASFGSNLAPAAQVAIFPQQIGQTVVGSAGLEWHRVVIEKSGTSATWHVDGTLMATIDLTTVTLGGANIFFGHSDISINATSSTDPNDAVLLFTLIDNVRVVPAPTSLAPIVIGVMALGRRRGKRG